MNRGFTLVEVLIVAGITGFISTFLILNFSRTRIDLNQSANLFVADIRLAETKATSSNKYNGYSPCGYGIHYISATQYATYVGPNAATVDCSTINRNYQAGEDTIIATRAFLDTKVQFKSSFSDIFFEPPDPKTYINNNASLAAPELFIDIGTIGGTCPQNCMTVKVITAGRVKVI
ncbi:type II secretion system GspH family protein [Candidatus Parcubacteria bacterium]|nr:type II secretion system GspH family protein [Candidatus Parcubacteria bacterium]